jgi:hypothetical protein
VSDDGTPTLDDVALVAEVCKQFLIGVALSPRRPDVQVKVAADAIQELHETLRSILEKKAN